MTNPLISLQAQVPSVGNALLTGQNIRANRDERLRRKRRDPLEERLLELQADQAELNLEQSDLGFQQDSRLRDVEIQLAKQQLANGEELSKQRQALLINDFYRNQLSGAAFKDRLPLLEEFSSRLGLEDDGGPPDDLSDEGIARTIAATDAVVSQLESERASSESFGFTEGGLVRDEAGNVFQQINRTARQAGTAESQLVPLDPSISGPVGAVTPVQSSGKTLEEESDIAVQEQREKSDIQTSAAAQRERTKGDIKRSNEMFDDARSIRGEIRTLKDIERLLKGQKGEVPRTGPVWSRLPNITSSAVRLENLGNRLGLNVLQNTTFGSLSEAEMNFALDTALPRNLEAPEMLKWAQDRINAQEKLAGELEIAAEMSRNGMSPAQIQKVMDGRAAQREADERQELTGVDFDPDLWEDLTDEERARVIELKGK